MIQNIALRAFLTTFDNEERLGPTFYDIKREWRWRRLPEPYRVNVIFEHLL